MFRHFNLLVTKEGKLHFGLYLSRVVKNVGLNQTNNFVIGRFQRHLKYVVKLEFNVTVYQSGENFF